MDYKIIFSDPAIADLENIVKYIARDNPDAASQTGRKLLECVRHLERFPRFGRMVPEQNDPNIRQIIYKPYRVFYRIKDSSKTIEVIRFWHGARGNPKFL